MADLEGQFINDSGVTELEGRLHVPAGISADSVNGVAVNNTPSVEGLLLTTVDTANCQWQEIITDAAAPPVAYVTPLVFDHTAVTGGLYAWDGQQYVQVGGPI
jgi:hypothetical protein